MSVLPDRRGARRFDRSDESSPPERSFGNSAEPDKLEGRLTTLARLREGLGYHSRMDRTEMTFAVGDNVTCPLHGATLVEQIETREVPGVEREHLALRYEDLHLTLRVPCDQATDAGLRQVIAGLEGDDVLDVLCRRNVRQPSNLSRRYKNHTEMHRSDDIYQLTEVLGNLAQQQRAKAVSAAEERMFDTARRLLVPELCLALGEDADQIDRGLDAALSPEPVVVPAGSAQSMAPST